MDLARKLSFLVVVLCVLISLKNQSAETNNDKNDWYSILSAERKILEIYNSEEEGLRYYYYESCPLAEQIFRSTVAELYEQHPDFALAILRLAFHDCFMQAGGPYNLHVSEHDANNLHVSSDDLPEVIQTFESKGLDERDNVILFGAEIPNWAAVIIGTISVVMAFFYCLWCYARHYPVHEGRRNKKATAKGPRMRAIPSKNLKPPKVKY